MKCDERVEDRLEGTPRTEKHDSPKRLLLLEAELLRGRGGETGLSPVGEAPATRLAVGLAAAC